MKTLVFSILVVGSIAAASVFAAPAASSSDAALPARPLVRSMSPATTPNNAVAGPAHADEVWVNRSSKVYHCPGNRWYGRTPNGIYLSEADAKAQGFKPEHGKSCS